MSRVGKQENVRQRHSNEDQLSLDSLKRQVVGFDGINPKALHAFNELTRTTRAVVAELDRAADGGGLSNGRNMILWSVLNHEGEEGLTPADLAEILDVTRASVTGLLKALEKDGLIVRKRSKKDGRSVHLGVTAKAKRLVKAEWPRASRNITLAFSQLSDAEKLTLVDLLQKVRSGLPELKSP
jgi:DNA-binding MarR family transcriptional regulator